MCRVSACDAQFDGERSFSLLGLTSQTASSVPTEVSMQHTISKLVVLVLHFPSLRLVWSPSPHATVDVFKSLKVSVRACRRCDDVTIDHTRRRCCGAAQAAGAGSRGGRVLRS